MNSWPESTASTTRPLTRCERKSGGMSRIDSTPFVSSSANTVAFETRQIDNPVGGLPAVHLSQNSHRNGEKQWPLGRTSGAVGIARICVHLSDPLGHRREKIADLGSDILPLEVGVPIDPFSPRM